MEDYALRLKSGKMSLLCPKRKAHRSFVHSDLY